MPPADRQARIARALKSLAGLSVGDALGEQFFGEEEGVMARIRSRQIPPGPWTYTDDTEMALSVVAVLRDYGTIEQDRLAGAFVNRFNPFRGYGGGAQQLLRAIGRNPHGAWRSLAPAMFGGQGSFGNGAAMRVAPLGAFFADDLALAAEQAELSSRITHTHQEGVAGAMAVAVAAAWMSGGQPWNRQAFFAAVLDHTPAGKTRRGLLQASDLPNQLSGAEAAAILGSGHEVSAQDTVPFALWCAAVEPDDFAATFWRTVEGLGDRDTTCAMACGVVAARGARWPSQWLASRERLPDGFSWEGASAPG